MRTIFGYTLIFYFVFRFRIFTISGIGGIPYQDEDEDGDEHFGEEIIENSLINYRNTPKMAPDIIIGHVIITKL